MAVEQRVVSSGKIGGGKPGGSIGARDKTPEPPPEPPKKSKKLLFIIIGVVVLVLGGAAAFFLLGSGGGEPEPEPTQEPGDILTIEPISLNLADGHYLRFGMSLQFAYSEGGYDAPEPDGSKAIDIAIALYSGRELAEVSSGEGREELKTELLQRIEEAYHGEVMDVYLTNYVTQ
ncbi:flagellar basal body-associated FliL family protein [Cellulomonas oligotrophica]|uniref:Flagellar protein FliL n=1 Tax=Cellulomonas oligotrophica TaxID=931536 RepID=A0A7Y9K0G2_9CELL|nr:flagellar basal body-associated FliL family protein [Cellulomonas oligotrophica]NYD87260.1 flagellar FliL protein [Cellulomonas oligotrophica]GIG34042.1 hypothetical protein Col01nite_32010 [Cellulomonas oligotrophica]